MMRPLAVAAALAAALLGPTAAASAQGAGADALTCTLALTRTDPASVNVAFPDEGAVYWGSGFAATPGTRLRITGRFPHARYMSFNLYNEQGAPFDALADVELVPEPGSANPFLAGADRTKPERSYTAFVEFGPPPAHRAPNTLYTGSQAAGMFLYRIYVPDGERDETGGVGLPTVSVEPQGATGSGAPSACANVDKPTVGSLNDAVSGSNGLPVPEAGEFPGQDPPQWQKFKDLPTSLVAFFFNNPYGDPFRTPFSALTEGRPGNGGFLSNIHNAYLTTAINRARGRVVVTTMHAPVAPRTRASEPVMGEGQTRYFSFCENEFFSQRYIACTTDDRTAVRADRSMTFVVSTPRDRPANARPECGVSWIPWGPVQEGVLIYRHMLSDPAFAQSIQKAARGNEAQTMGAYTPVSRYFADRAAYEATGCAPVQPSGAGGAATALRCTVTAGFRAVRARAVRGGGARVKVTRRLRRSFVVDVFRVADGRRVGGVRRVRTARRSGSFSLPRSRPGAVDVVRLTMSLPGGRHDVRRIVLSTGADGRRRVLAPFYRRDDCALVRSAKLSSPVFGGVPVRGVGVALKLNRSADLDVTVMRGGRVVRRLMARSRRPGGPTLRMRLSGGLPRGSYTMVVRAADGITTDRVVLHAVRR